MHWLPVLQIKQLAQIEKPFDSHSIFPLLAQDSISPETTQEASGSKNSFWSRPLCAVGLLVLGLFSVACGWLLEPRQLKQVWGMEGESAEVHLPRVKYKEKPSKRWDRSEALCNSDSRKKRIFGISPGNVPTSYTGLQELSHFLQLLGVWFLELVGTASGKSSFQGWKEIAGLVL